MLLVALAPFLVASCDGSSDTNKDLSQESKVSKSVSRVHDSELGVTCWTINSRSISCLRDDDNTKDLPTPSPAPVNGGWPAVSDSEHVAGGPG